MGLTRYGGLGRADKILGGRFVVSAQMGPQRGENIEATLKPPLHFIRGPCCSLQRSEAYSDLKLSDRAPTRRVVTHSM